MFRRRPAGAENHQDQIAKTALRLVAEHGADRVTLVDVTKALGITRATVARHCATDEDLWRLTTAFIERRMNEAWEAVMQQDVAPTGRLRSLLSVHLGMVMAIPAMREFLFSRGIHQPGSVVRPQLFRIRARFKALLTELLKDGVRAGELKPQLDADTASRRIMETMQGLVLGWSLEVEAENAFEDAWAQVEALIKPEERQLRPGRIAG
jgi:AcrR family transcriptional regulator